MDNVLIVVDDLEAAKAFFVELGMELEGETIVEGNETAWDKVLEVSKEKIAHGAPEPQRPSVDTAAVSLEEAEHEPAAPVLVRVQRLDVLQLGQELTSIAWGSKKPIPLPPSANKVSDVPNTK